MNRITVCLAGLMALSHGIAAEVYKTVDSQGVVTYTDRPALLPAEKLGLQTRPTDPAAVAARAEAERARLAASGTAQDQAATQQADQRGATELTATARAEQCVKARERYNTYMTSQRLFEELPDGQRRYLTDAELDSAREGARTAMDAMCN